MKRLLPALVLVSVTACGLADDERDEENKYIYPTFSDKTFEAYCLGEFDLDGNGRISRYEAQRVVRIDCSGRGIASLADVAEFANLRELDCRGNNLVRLDVSALARLERLDCSENRLASLDVEGLRALVSLDCGGNPLRQLNLSTNASLMRFGGRGCGFGTLDLSQCARWMELADVRGCPSLALLYVASGQRFGALRFDGPSNGRAVRRYAHGGFPAGRCFNILLKSPRVRCGFSENISYLWMQKMSFALNFYRLQ